MAFFLKEKVTLKHLKILGHPSQESAFKYKNFILFSQLLLLLSGYISLNPGPVHQGTLQYSNELDVFKKRGLHFIHLNINSLLPKIEKLRFIAKSTNAVVIGICESKLEASVLEQETSIDDYKILRFCKTVSLYR